MGTHSREIERRKIGPISVVIVENSDTRDPRKWYDVYVLGDEDLIIATDGVLVETVPDDDEVLEILDDADLLGPICFACRQPCGPTYHIVGMEDDTYCCDDDWDERLR